MTRLYTLHHIANYSRDKMKENEMAEACNIHRVNRKAYRNSARRPKGRVTLKTEE